MADKILLGHLDDPENQELEPGKSYLQTRPDRDGTDGFFIARLRRAEA